MRYCSTFDSASVHSHEYGPCLWGCGLIATPDPCLHQHFLLPGSVQGATFTSFLAIFHDSYSSLFSTVHPLFTAFILFSVHPLLFIPSYFASQDPVNLVIQFSSVAQSCPTLCDPRNHSTPGLPVHNQLPEFTQTHFHRVSDAIQPSHPLLSPSSPAPNPSQHQSLFQ